MIVLTHRLLSLVSETSVGAWTFPVLRLIAVYKPFNDDFMSEAPQDDSPTHKSTASTVVYAQVYSLPTGEQLSAGMCSRLTGFFNGQIASAGLLAYKRSEFANRSLELIAASWK